MARINDDANLFRHVVHPISFRGGRFAPQKFLWLKDQNDEVVASVAWQRYLPTDQYIHRYGCRLAAKINERKIAAGTFKEKNRHTYCGSYGLVALAIRALPGTEGLDEVASAEVTHLIEDGEIAHTEIRIVFRPGTSSEAAKTAIIDRLWNACRGPLRHVCDVDAGMADHPSEDLVAGPLGQYVDSRSWFLRACWCAGFFIRSWVQHHQIRGTLTNS